MNASATPPEGAFRPSFTVTDAFDPSFTDTVVGSNLTVLVDALTDTDTDAMLMLL